MTENASTALVAAVVDLDETSALALRTTFGPLAAQADEWMAKAQAINVTSADQKEEIALARESRLGLKSIRTRVEKLRKQLKEESLRKGQAIDKVAGAVKALIEPIEAVLLEQEEFVERQTKARLDEIRARRTKELRDLGADPFVYADLALMTDGAWADALTAARVAKDAREAKAKADREAAEKAEAERVAKQKELEAENAKLRAEAEKLEAEKQLEIAKARADAEAREMAERAEREKAEAVARAEREKAAAAERELAAERERVAKEERDRKAEEERRAAAPDREKLVAFAAELRAMALPVMTTARGQEITGELRKRLQQIARAIDDAASGMGGTGEERAA